LSGLAATVEDGAYKPPRDATQAKLRAGGGNAAAAAETFTAPQRIII